MDNDSDGDPNGLMQYLIELDAREQASPRFPGPAGRPYRSDRPVCIADDQPNEHFLTAVDLGVATQEPLSDEGLDILWANLAEFTQSDAERWSWNYPRDGSIEPQVLRRRGSDVRLLKMGTLYLSSGEREEHFIDARSQVRYESVSPEAADAYCGLGDVPEITLARSRIKEGQSRISRQCDLILDDQKRLKRALYAAGSRGWRGTAEHALRRIEVTRYFTVSSPLEDLQVPIDFRLSGLEWLRSTGWIEEPEENREFRAYACGVAPRSSWRDPGTGGRRMVEIVDANTIAVTATLEGFRVVQQAVGLHCHGLSSATRFDLDMLGAVLGQLAVRLCAEVDAMAFQVLGG